MAWLQWRLTPEFVVVVAYVRLAAGKLQPKVKRAATGNSVTKCKYVVGSVLTATNLFL